MRKVSCHGKTFATQKISQNFTKFAAKSCACGLQLDLKRDSVTGVSIS